MLKQQFLRLQGFTRADRIQLTTDVSQAISRSGAWITDFHQYSNVLICINFEVPCSDVQKLSEALQQTNLKLSEDSLVQLMQDVNSSSNNIDLVGTLQITFIHDEPDLFREIPAVPG